jgi:hypothetical protein
VVLLSFSPVFPQSVVLVPPFGLEYVIHAQANNVHGIIPARQSRVAQVTLEAETAEEFGGDGVAQADRRTILIMGFTSDRQLCAAFVGRLKKESVLQKTG